MDRRNFVLASSMTTLTAALSFQSGLLAQQADVYRRARRIVSEKSGLDESRIAPDMRFDEDLVTRLYPGNSQPCGRVSRH